MGRFLQRIFGDHHQNQSCGGNGCGQAMYDGAYGDSNSGQCAPRPVFRNQQPGYGGQQPGFVDCNQGYGQPAQPQQFRASEGVRRAEYRNGTNEYSTVTERSNPYKPKSDYNEDTFTDAANRAAKEGKPLVVVVGNENDPRTNAHLSRAWGAQQGYSEQQGRPDSRHYYKDDAIFVNVDPAKVKEGSVLAGVFANQQIGKDSAPTTLVLGTTNSSDGARLRTQQRFNNPADSFGIISEIDRAKAQLKPLNVTYTDAKSQSDAPAQTKKEEAKKEETKPEAAKPEAAKPASTPADVRKRVMEALSQDTDPETRARVMRALDEIEAEKAKAKPKESDKPKTTELPKTPEQIAAENAKKAREAASSQPVDLYGENRNGVKPAEKQTEKPAARTSDSPAPPVPNPPPPVVETAHKPREVPAPPVPNPPDTTPKREVPAPPVVQKPAAKIEPAKPAPAKINDLGPDVPKVEAPKPPKVEPPKPDAIDPRALSESVFQFQMAKIRGFDDFYKNETARQDKAMRSIDAAGTNSAEAAKLLGYDDMNLIGHRQFEAKVKDQYGTFSWRSTIKTEENKIADQRAEQWAGLRKLASDQTDPNYIHKQMLLHEIATGKHIAYKEGIKVSNYNEDRDKEGNPIISARGTWQIEAAEKLAEIAKDPKLNHEVVARSLPELLRNSQVPTAAKLKALEGVVALAQDKTSGFMDVRGEDAKKTPDFPYADGKPKDVAVAAIIKAMHADNNSWSGKPNMEFQEAALKALVQLKAVESINQLRAIQGQTTDANLRNMIGKYAEKLTDAAKPADSAIVERTIRAQMQQRGAQPAGK